MVKKIRKYLYSFDATHGREGRTDGQADRRTPHDGIGRAYASHSAAMTVVTWHADLYTTRYVWRRVLYHRRSSRRRFRALGSHGWLRKLAIGPSTTALAAGLQRRQFIEHTDKWLLELISKLINHCQQDQCIFTVYTNSPRKRRHQQSLRYLNWRTIGF